MKKIKKLLLLTAILTVIVGAFSIGVSAGTVANGTCGDNLTWTLDENGLLTISGQGDMYDYDTSNTAPWIGQSVTSVKILDGVTSIGYWAFAYCYSLTSIEIPDSVTSIGVWAFFNCRSLTSIEIPDSVTSIGNSAFRYCSSLTSIKIPESVTSIGSSAFYECSSLTSITVDENNEYYSSDDRGSLFNKDKTTLIQYPIGNTAESYIIPDSVTSIGNSAFYECSSLTSIKIPESVTSIGSSAFSGCEDLTSIEIPESVTSIGSSAFYECSSLTSIKIPEGVTSIGNSAFRYCSSLTSIEIPNSVTSIGDYAFWECSSLTSIKIPESVTSIGSSAFYECSSLTSITVDENNEYYSSDDRGSLFNKDKTTLIQYPIGNTAESYIIPDSVTSIGNSAFYECSSLTSIKIPDSVTSIGNSAFDGCRSLKSIEIPNSVTSIGYSAFGDCSSLTSIKIPESVTSIGSYAFGDCDNLTSIEIPESVTSIESSAFSSCDNLTSIKIPDSVTSIGSSAFSYCYNLTSIYYGGVKSQFVKINIGTNNAPFNSATVYYQGVSVTGVTLDKSSITLEKEATTQLIATVIPENASDKTVSWSTSNANVATVVEGVVTAISAGEAEITATTADGGFTATCKVTVTAPPTVLDRDTVLVLDNSGSMDGTPLGELKEAAIKFCETVLAAEGTNRIAIVIYDSDVTTYGFTTSLASLKSYINSMDGSGSTYMNKGLNSAATLLSDSVADMKSVVLMTDGIPSCSESEVKSAANTVKQTAHLFTLGFYHDTSSSTPAKLLESIQNAGYYEVTDGSQLDSTFMDIGEKITRIPVTSIVLDKQEIVLVEGQNGVLNASIEPHDATNKGIYWSSADPEIASVSASGVITAVSQGKTVVSAVSADSNEMVASCTVIVNDTDAWYYTYTVKSDGTAEITGYRTGLASDISIPQYVDRYLVTGIGSSAFSYCRSLTSIEIPECVTSIGYEAFYYCISLTSIEIPDSVTSIGNYAFKDCISLTSIEIPVGVTSIGNYAFYGCSSLTSIEIPDSVTSIGNYAFSNCSSLTSITVDENNEYYSSDDRGSLFNKDKTTLIQYPIGKMAESYIIPDSVTSIGYEAFSYCSSLTSIEIPDSVTSIGSSAFYNCSSLTSITVDENNGYYSSDDRGSLFNKNKTTLIQYPIGNTAESYIIPDSVTSIRAYAFSSCSSLTSIEIPVGVTSIGDSAFYECRSLTSIEIPDSVTSIEDYAFSRCSNLTSIEIPVGVTSIGYYAFEYCRSLTSIEIPEGVTSIGGFAFYYCSSLTSVEIPDSVTSIGSYAFSGCKKLTIYGYADSTAESYASSNSIPFEYLHKIKATCENGVYTVSAVYGGKDAPTGKIMAAIYEGGVLQEVKILDAKETQTFEFQKKVSEGNVRFIWLSDSETMQPKSKMLEMDV